MGINMYEKKLVASPLRRKRIACLTKILCELQIMSRKQPLESLVLIVL